MRVLVVSPHMDDETFGAGGTMCRYAEAGDAVYWLNLANTKTEYGYPEELVNRRESQRLKVANALGIREAIDLKLRPAALAEYSDAEVISKIAEIVRKIEPEGMITVFPGDIHSDHAETFKWVKALSKSFRIPSLKRFMLMKVVSETDFSLMSRPFIPNYYVDISAFLGKKLEILKIYDSELGKHPFPRSLENVTALATSRGAVAGTTYAEAFMMLREIEK